jgi:3-hydroxymyristoyl/3-hydroxydecanoyl-(acyl carrier protein) dehydratase
MALIKNNTSRGIDFVVRGAAVDGVPPTAIIPPGQAREIDVDLDSAQVRGMAHVGSITIVGGEKAAPAHKAPAPEKPAQSLAETAKALELSPKPSPKTDEGKRQ